MINDSQTPIRYRLDVADHVAYIRWQIRGHFGAAAVVLIALMPLLVFGFGLPFAGVAPRVAFFLVGGCFMYWAAPIARTRLAMRKFPILSEPVEMSLRPVGLCVRGPLHELVHPWHSIAAPRELRNHIAVVIAESQHILVPKRAFDSAADLNTFMRAVEAYRMRPPNSTVAP